MALAPVTTCFELRNGGSENVCKNNLRRQGGGGGKGKDGGLRLPGTPGTFFYFKIGSKIRKSNIHKSFQKIQLIPV
jgi:hypothetical protein